MERTARRDLLRIRRVTTESARAATEPHVADRWACGGQCLGVRMRGRVEDRFRASLLDDLARIHDGQAVRDLDEHRKTAGDEQERQAEVGLERPEEWEALRLHRAVARARRRVGN